MSIRVHSTSGVSLDATRHVANATGTELPIEVDEGQTFFKGGTPPSWVTFFREADLWIKALGAYVAIYVAEIVKEAGKDTWRNRAKLVSTPANLIRKYADALKKLRGEIEGRTEIAIEVALFVHYLPGLKRLF